MNFAALLRLAIRTSNTSQHAVSLDSGINYYRVNRLARGVAQPKATEIRALARHLPLLSVLDKNLPRAGEVDGAAK